MAGLNPLGIGESFERTPAITNAIRNSLNPLGIGEGFELEKARNLQPQIES